MTERARTQRKLKAELEQLKRILDLGRELQVVWLPGHARYVNGRKIIGEVRGDSVFVYAENEDMALEVLRHEVIENLIVSKFTLPYKTLLNTLLGAFEETFYVEKEELVKKLSHLIWRGAKKRQNRGQEDEK